MAVLFMDGFDARDLANKWDDTSYSGYSSSTRFATGLASASTTLLKRFTPSSQIFVGAAYYGGFVLTLKADSGSRSHISLSISDTIMTLKRDTVTIASYDNYPSSSWCYVEIGATIDDTAGQCIVRLNGQQVISFTGDTMNGGTSQNIDAITIGSATVDDLYICDSSGIINNTFLGDIRIQTLVPTAAGSSTQLTPTGGANYANVADIPDSTATYNASSTVGNKDLYALGDLAATTTTVKCVQVNTHSWKDDAGTASLKAKIKSGSTEADGATTSLPSSVAWVGDRWETDPDTSAAWTVSAVNSLEAGAEVA